VDYGRIARDAWAVTVRTRPLWYLGAICAAEAAFSSAALALLAVPMSIIPQAVTGADPSAAAPFSGSRERVVLDVAQWLGGHLAAVTVGVAIALCVWLVIGAVGVAAQTGIVTQVAAVAEARAASVGAGVRDGFRLWWRVVALLAIAALPGLVYLLVMAVVMTFTITVPLVLGKQPDPGTVLLANLGMSPLAPVTTLVAVPLGVLVELGVRFGVLDGVEWRPAFASAWRLARADFAEIALTYVLVTIVAAAASVAFAVIALSCGAVTGAVALGAGLLATAGDAAQAGRAAVWVGGGASALLFVAFEAVMFVWHSAVWTLVWRDRTGRSPDSKASGYRPQSPGVTAPTTERGL